MCQNNRIKLLSASEIEDIYSLPDFNEEERALYFDFTEEELATSKKYRTVNVQIYFLLTVGYFKATQQLHQFNMQDIPQDAEYIAQHYFGTAVTQTFDRPDQKTRKKQFEDALNLFAYKNWSESLRQQIESHLCKLLQYYPKGHDAVRQLLIYFGNQNIVVPRYRKLQNIFTSAFITEEKRLNALISSVSSYTRAQLSTLLEKKDGITQLNMLRADQKDFQYTAVRGEVEKAQQIADLYCFAKDFIPSLKLSKNAVRYYADITEQYAASRLRRLSAPQQYLHVLCFVYHRYQQIMDNLITSFMYHVKTMIDAGKTYAEMALLQHSADMVVDFPKLAQFLKWFPNRGKDLSHEGLNQAAYNILPKEQFQVLAKFLEGNTFDKKVAKWEFYAKSSRMLSLYLRPILLAVDFTYYKKNNQLMDLVSLLKNHYSKGKSPAEFKLADAFGFIVPQNMERYLKTKPSDQWIDPHRFEFFVYRKMYHQLIRGRMCCNDSISYCDIEYDLVSDDVVDDAEKIAAEFGYPKIPVYCDERLDTAISELNAAWKRTTENIRGQHNAGFNLKGEKAGKPDWSLLYDSKEKLDDAFFRTLSKAEIADIMMFVGNRAGMWDSFTHMKDRYIKRETPAALAINGCVLSEAFGFGEMKMAEMSDLNFNVLRATREDFVRVESLCTANNRISNYIHTLPIFKLWNLLGDKLLADTDGQKFATTNNTIQSRFSKKYLGKGKGISLYTLIANFVAVNAKNIGLNEYEGHSLYDMIYGNKTDIDIDMVTGDNHSLNKLNFVALDSIDVDYIPSIKNVREAANDLYSAVPPDIYTGAIQPTGKINIERIKSQKKGILRVLLSLIMQENTQTNIIRKLNSHARYARLKAALFEYNKIFKSTHVLNLIDNMQLRQAIRAARNRTEAYHQLQKLIRKIYSGIFKGKKIVDNRVSAHAARLVANCIIAYNSTILNAVYEKMLKNGVSQKIIDEFARISPIAWTHVAFTGRYSFKKDGGNFNIEMMALELEKHLKQGFWR